MKLIKVYVDDELYEKLKAKAGDVPLSKWMRITASNEVFWNPPLTPEQQAAVEMNMPKIGSTVTIKTPPRFTAADGERVDTSICEHNMFKSACRKCR